MTAHLTIYLIIQFMEEQSKEIEINGWGGSCIVTGFIRANYISGIRSNSSNFGDILGGVFIVKKYISSIMNSNEKYCSQAF